MIDHHAALLITGSYDVDQDLNDIPDQAKAKIKGDAVDLTPVYPSLPGLRLQHLMFAIAVIAVFIWLAILTGPYMIPISIIVLIAIGIGFFVILVSRRDARYTSLLWAMAIAAERSMPLAPTALVFADQSGFGVLGWGFRRKVAQFAAMLNNGLPLPTALGRVAGLLPRDAELLVRVGYATDTLGRSLREAATLRASRERVLGTTFARLAYLAELVIVMHVIVGFVFYFILPKFEAIFYDFGVTLPPVTVFASNLGFLFMRYSFIVIPLLLLIEVLLPLACLLAVLFRLVNWWDIPVVGGLFRRRHSALIMRALALAVAGRRPIPAVIALLSSEYPSDWVRTRLLAVSAELSQGRDWVESLADRGLIRRAEAAVLRAAQRVNNLDWALLELAEAVDRRIAYRLQFWLDLSFPVAIVGMGGLVGLFATAYFTPLVTLIRVLAG